MQEPNIPYRASPNKPELTFFEEPFQPIEKTSTDWFLSHDGQKTACLLRPGLRGTYHSPADWAGATVSLEGTLAVIPTPLRNGNAYADSLLKLFAHNEGDIEVTLTQLEESLGSIFPAQAV